MRFALAVSGFIFAGVLAAASPATANDHHSMLAYFGTYTGGKSKGIYVARFDENTGTFTAPELAVETANPTFLAVHPSKPVLYAVAEVNHFAEKRSGGVCAFEIDPASGKLTLLNEEPSGGTGPCHVSVDTSGRCLLVANYGSGSVAAFPLTPDGRIGPASTTLQHHGSSVDPERQKGPHAHFFGVDPENRFALSADLGLDEVLVYRLDPERASLIPNDPPFFRAESGSGPRHLTFHPDGHHAFLITEMGSTVSMLNYDPARGVLDEVCTVSTLPEGYTGFKSGAEVAAPPNGKFLYASDRGNNSLVVFAISLAEGTLKTLQRISCGGKMPRHFVLSPSGKWLIAANQESDNVVVFRIDPATGLLEPSGVTLEVGAPVCVMFFPKP